MGIHDAGDCDCGLSGIVVEWKYGYSGCGEEEEENDL